MAWRAATAQGTIAVKLVARDPGSGFAIFAPDAAELRPWSALPAAQDGSDACAPGTPLEFPGSPGATARCAGRDILVQGRLLDSPWLRVHLPPGTWPVGTPLTAGGKFAGLLAGPVPGAPDAARMLPARAVWHFAGLYRDRKKLTRPFLGLRLDHASALPLVRECHAALPAERAGIQPGDVLLRIGAQDVATAAEAVETCFYLRVDDDVPVRLLRGTTMLDVTLRPVPAAPAGK
jgi:PDZ domain